MLFGCSVMLILQAGNAMATALKRDWLTELTSLADVADAEQMSHSQPTSSS